MSIKHPQHILALDKSNFPEFAGFLPIQFNDMVELARKSLIVARREELEKDERYGQVIPYVIFRQRDKVFAYRRTPKAGEVRLHGNVSVGLGGHIDIDDIESEEGIINFLGTLANAMRRELDEELIFQKGFDSMTFSEICAERAMLIDGEEMREYAPDFVGMINDTSNPVGRVHYGLVFVYDLPSIYKPLCREEELDALGWLRPKSLLLMSDIENWTQIALENVKFNGADHA